MALVEFNKTVASYSELFCTMTSVIQLVGDYVEKLK